MWSFIETLLLQRFLSQFREFVGILHVISRTGCPPYATRVRGGSSWDDCRRGRGRKKGSEGGKKALACANRGASFRAARCAPRLHLPEIHHLCVPPPPVSPAPFCLLPSCFYLHLFPLLLCSLTSHGTQLPTTSLSWPAITQAPLATWNGVCCCTKNWDTVRESLKSHVPGSEEERATTDLRELGVRYCTSCCWISTDILAKVCFLLNSKQIIIL